MAPEVRRFGISKQIIYVLTRPLFERLDASERKVFSNRIIQYQEPTLKVIGTKPTAVRRTFGRGTILGVKVDFNKAILKYASLDLPTFTDLFIFILHSSFTTFASASGCGKTLNITPRTLLRTRI